MFSSGPKRVSTEEAYRLWAPFYDTQPNPITHLEQRIVSALLPAVLGKSVIDLGCGTGRWAKQFVRRGARSVVGVDSSAAMLTQAERELAGKCTLIRSDCRAVPSGIAPADVLVASFLLSYLEDLDGFAAQVRRLVRANTEVYASDIHPLTAQEQGWSRGFRAGNLHVEVKTRNYSLTEILETFEKYGMQADIRLEPAFGEPERALFQSAGKTNVFDECSRLPAIYVFRFRQQQSNTWSALARRDALQRIRGGQLVLDSRTSTEADLHIAHGRVSHLASQSLLPSHKTEAVLDLGGYLVFPGLINAHDHLEFALFPRLGSGPYVNSSQWAESIYKPDASPIREHRAVPKPVRLWWGGLRNLLAGVTTVCHHNPSSRTVLHPDFPVRVVRDFDWAHSLAFDREGICSHRSHRRPRPFIIHAAEGIDSGCAEELFELDRMGVLDENTVVVHGIGAGTSGRELLQSRHASLVWCPTSNHFLFGQTHLREHLAQLGCVALGTDSSLTATGDLLDEMQFARKLGIDSDLLYSMVSAASVRCLKLSNREGTIQPGAWADIVAIRDQGRTPADCITSTNFRHIELVVLAGRVRLASPRIFEQFPAALTEHMQLLEIAGELRWVRAPLQRLFRDAAHQIGSDVRMNGRPVRYVGHAAA